MKLSRRSALQLGGSALASAMLPSGAAFAQSQFAGRQVVYATWGGDYERAQVKAYCDSFAADTGANVIVDGPVNSERVRVMLESGAADWQVICANDAMMYSLSQEALLAKVDESIVDLSQVPEEFRFEYGVAIDTGASVLSYSTTAFSGDKVPSTWADMFDLETFPGRRMLSSSPRGMLELALLADGVAPADLYPLDLDRAFAKLDQIKDDTVFYESYSQNQQLIVDGAVAMGPLFSNRAYTVISNGANVGMSWDGNLRNVTPVFVPAAAADLDLCWAFVNNMLAPRNQASVANDIAVSPTNPAALEFVRPDLVPWLPALEANSSKGVALSVDYWGANLTEVTSRWQEWLLV